MKNEQHVSVGAPWQRVEMLTSEPEGRDRASLKLVPGFGSSSVPGTWKGLVIESSLQPQKEGNTVIPTLWQRKLRLLSFW